MAATLTVRDESLAGGVSNEWSFAVLSETLTIRDLIRERVYQDVQDDNVRQHAAGPYRGLVRPEGDEQALNWTRSRLTDWKKQFEKAVEAFEANQILILIDDRQAESLDQSFTIGPGTVVTFLRLTLLVGG